MQGMRAGARGAVQGVEVCGVKASELPTVICDTREPHEEAGDRPEAVFRPWVYAPGTPRDTPFRDRPRVYLPTVRRALDVGDYALDGVPGVALERKSGADLLSTLFGDAGLDSVGEAQHNIDRFRRELERARGYDLFAIVVEGDEGGVFREAQRRFERYGKAFDPEAVTGLLSSFFVDLRVPVLWCSWAFAMDEVDCAHCRGGMREVFHERLGAAPIEIACEACAGSGLARVRRQIMTAKECAELAVGRILTRVWSQATGGEKARDARKRGYTMPWLDALAVPPSLPDVDPDAEPVHGAGVVAEGPVALAEEAPGPRFAPLGGMTPSTAEALGARSRKRNPDAPRRGRSWSRRPV